MGSIDEKVLRGEKLTSKEVCFIFCCYNSIAEKSGEHHRWWYPVYKVFQIGKKYFQVWGAIGLTEHQEDEFEPQVAIEVKRRKKLILKEEWVPVDDL